MECEKIHWVLCPGLLGQNPHLDPGGYHTGKFPAVLPQV